MGKKKRKKPINSPLKGKGKKKGKKKKERTRYLFYLGEWTKGKRTRKGGERGGEVPSVERRSDRGRG